VIFDYTKIDESGRIVAQPRFGKGEIPWKKAFSGIISLKISPTAWNKLYKTSLFTKNNVFYPEKFLHEDLPTTYKLFWHAESIGFVDKSYYFWLTRSGSITQKFSKKHVDDILSALFSIRIFLEQKGVFSEFKNEYFRSCFQMLSLTYDRSSISETSRSELVRHINEKIDDQGILGGLDIFELEKYDSKIVQKFRVSQSNALESLDSGISQTPTVINKTISFTRILEKFRTLIRRVI
jgi:hypothetical protein